jgi:hypothetical protein
VPAVTISAVIMGPLLTASTDTFGSIFLNGSLNLVGNGLEAALTAPLAIFVARSVTRASTHEVVAPEADVQQGEKAS